jgi:hypothetical protein
VPIVASGGRYLVQVTLPGEETPLLLVPDSGANGIVMYARDGGTARGLVSVRGLSGTHNARTVMMRELRVGNAILRNQPVAVLERGPAGGAEGDGLLPLHLFSSVTFNPREGYLSVRGASGPASE